MREFHDRRLVRRLFFSWVSFIILAVLLFFSVRGLLSVYERYTQAKVLREAAEARLQGFEKRKSELESAIGFLGSARGFEEEVRKRFGVVREGEGVIEIVDAPAATSGASEVKRNLLERFLDLF